MSVRTMANLEYSFMARELQPIVHKFFDQFYELDDGRFRLKFGRDIIIIELGTRFHKTKYVENAPPATAFAMKVRKELKGKRLTELSQHGSDRIMVLDFEGTQLIAEMFGNGNLLLVREGKIIAVYSKKRWKDRALISKAEYFFPPSSTKTLEEIFEDNPASAVGAALRDLDIGMTYVRTILKAAKVKDSKNVDSLSDSEKAAISESLNGLLSRLKPGVSYDGDSPNSFSLCGGEKEFPTLSEALDEYFGAPEFVQEEAEEKESNSARLERLKESQQKRLDELTEEEEEAKKCADFIYSHYEDFEALLQAYRKQGIKPIEELAEKRGWKLNVREKVLEISA
ncbi:NFACT family protein [Candidatus Micrarchaeota archaeon]|nr:NFACT family protein [Candidatus Micrarchaeota archaeon]